MAGTLEVTEDRCWMPPGWVYDNVLDSCAANVQSDHPELARLLRASRTHVNGGYLDLRATDSKTLEVFLSALCMLEEQCKLGGPDEFAEPEAYSGYLRWLRELIEMLNQSIAERPDP